MLAPEWLISTSHSTRLSARCIYFCGLFNDVVSMGDHECPACTDTVIDEFERLQNWGKTTSDVRWGRSQWPSSFKARAAARLLGLRVRIPSGAWMSVCCECRVLSGRGICNGPISRPEEFYRLWCVIVCDLETSRMRRPWPALGCCARQRERAREREKLRIAGVPTERRTRHLLMKVFSVSSVFARTLLHPTPVLSTWPSLVMRVFWTFEFSEYGEILMMLEDWIWMDRLKLILRGLHKKHSVQQTSNLCTNLAFTVGPRKTWGNFDRWGLNIPSNLH